MAKVAAVVELCVSTKALTVLAGVKARMVQIRLAVSTTVKDLVKQPLSEYHTPVTIVLKI